MTTCADKPVRLRAADWSNGLATSVDDRLEARNGQDKGRVFYVWSSARGGGETPVACCAWHLHRGNWPLCVLDAGWSRALDEEQGQPLVENVIFAALRQLAADPHVWDTAVPRPSDRLGWHVDHQAGAGHLAERKQRARTAATRAQRDFAFARLSRGQRPSWARDGFYGERVFS